MFFRKKQKVDLEANFEEKHFLSLKESVEEETKRVEGLLDED